MLKSRVVISEIVSSNLNMKMRKKQKKNIRSYIMKSLKTFLLKIVQDGQLTLMININHLSEYENGVK
uniref:Uncharacterized protein n=1 Tax=Megaselia scalaris TaxID=36166 RepID=T1GF30_MEGSC